MNWEPAGVKALVFSTGFLTKFYQEFPKHYLNKLQNLIELHLIDRSKQSRAFGIKSTISKYPNLAFQNFIFRISYSSNQLSIAAKEKYALKNTRSEFLVVEQKCNSSQEYL